MKKVEKISELGKIKVIVEGDYIRQIHINRTICYLGSILRIRKTNDELLYKGDVKTITDGEWMIKYFPSNRSISDGLKIEISQPNNTQDENKTLYGKDYPNLVLDSIIVYSESRLSPDEYDDFLDKLENL